MARFDRDLLALRALDYRLKKSDDCMTFARNKAFLMIYRFGKFIFDPDRTDIFDGERAIALEPQVFRLLKYLLEHRDRIVSKEELNEKIWHGRVVSDSALSTRIRAVRRLLEDDHAQQKYIRTFPKRGFQFVHTVDERSEDDRQESKSDEVSPKSAASVAPRWFKPATMVALMVLIVASVAWWVTWSNGAPSALPLPDKPSIAVMRFTNQGGGQQEQYFVDGLTEDIIASLSRNRELFVSSRHSSFSDPDVAVDVALLGRELGVAFIARGAIRRADRQLRISIELIEAATGKIVWADKFDRNIDDVFATQDQITQAITAQIAPEMVQARLDQARSKPTDSLDAWDLYLRARAQQHIFTESAQHDAIRLAGLAIERDPSFAAPRSLIARAKGVQYFFQWAPDRQRVLDEAIDAARAAIALEPNDPVAHAALGYIYRFTGDETQSIANLVQAAKHKPNDAHIQLELAHALDWFRQHKRALPHINLAIRLSPRDPLLQNMLFYKAHTLFHLRDFDASLKASERMAGVLSSNTWRVLYQLVRAASLIELNRPSDAQTAVNAALAINPKLSISAMKKQFVGSKNHPENRRIWLLSLRKAGVPE